jgi:hypothetical protein
MLFAKQALSDFLQFTHEIIGSIWKTGTVTWNLEDRIKMIETTHVGIGIEARRMEKAENALGTSIFFWWVIIAVKKSLLLICFSK